MMRCKGDESALVCQVGLWVLGLTEWMARGWHRSNNRGVSTCCTFALTGSSNWDTKEGPNHHMSIHPQLKGFGATIAVMLVATRCELVSSLAFRQIHASSNSSLPGGNNMQEHRTELE